VIYGRRRMHTIFLSWVRTLAPRLCVACPRLFARLNQPGARQTKKNRQRAVNMSIYDLIGGDALEFNRLRVIIAATLSPTLASVSAHLLYNISLYDAWSIGKGACPICNVDKHLFAVLRRNQKTQLAFDLANQLFCHHTRVEDFALGNIKKRSGD
jgi:hypothetical protein